jgi:hypothetical protein
LRLSNVLTLMMQAAATQLKYHAPLPSPQHLRTMLSRSSLSLSRRFFSVLSSPSPRDVVIVSAVRTPVGLFNGGLAPLSATQLGAAAVKAAISRGGIKNEDVDEVIMGNVVSAGIGQAPARQAAKFAGLPDKTICNTINKVCSSGMKAVMSAAQTIALGQVNSPTTCSRFNIGFSICISFGVHSEPLLFWD